MFVQSGQFIAEHRKELQSADSDVYVSGQEKTRETINLAKMNLAVNGLRGEVKQANTYYEDPFGSFGAFDYVLANPPFNVDDVSPAAWRRTNASTLMAFRATNPRPRNRTRARKPSPTRITCGSISLPPR
jgi:type I restriction-modification system DNA methylase subunit